MKQKTLIALLALAFLATAPSAFAEEAGDGTGSAETSVTSEITVEGEIPTLINAPVGERKEKLDIRKDQYKEKRDQFQEKREEGIEKREEQREQFKENREEKKTQLEERRAEFGEKREAKRIEFAENASERIEAHLDRFIRLLGAAIERGLGLITRLENRADELDAEGKNTSEARAYLQTATDELSAAQSDLARIEADISATFVTDAELTKEVLKAAFQNTKTAIESAKKHIRAAHEAVRAALKSLKALVSVDASIEGSGEGE